MDEMFVLDPAESVPERPFADPENSERDAGILRGILGRLRQVIRDKSAWADARTPVVLFPSEPDGRSHRVALARPNLLENSSDLTLVGFFGQKRPGAALSILEGMDQELLRNLLLHPGVLSYSTLQLEGGDFGNMVVMAYPEAIDSWRTNPKHGYAVSILSPRYYASIRLHNFSLPGGLHSGLDPVLLRTKYFDYRNGQTWQAIRDLSAS